MFCKNCSASIQEDAAFCQKCGTAQGAHQPHMPPPVYNVVIQREIPPANGLATASMIMGILALTILGPIGGILGFIFALRAKSLGNRGGKATAGLIMSIISLVFWLLVVGVFIFGIVLTRIY